MSKCLHCKKKTTNPKFCSQSCSASYNNRGKIKNPRTTRVCSWCSTKFTAAWKESKTLCQSCIQTRFKPKTTTLGEYRDRLSVKGKHPSWLHSGIRVLGRLWNQHLPKVCQACGYSKHIHFCHIKPISKFPDSATIGEVNDPSNIKILCPNCHWEFDHP